MKQIEAITHNPNRKDRGLTELSNPASLSVVKFLTFSLWIDELAPVQMLHVVS